MILWTISEAYLSVISINLPSCFQLYKRATKKGLVAVFARDTYAENAPSTRHKSDVYSRDAYGFSPIDTTFAARMQNRKSGVTSYINRLSASQQNAQEDDEDTLLHSMAPVHIRKDITVSTDRPFEDEKRSPV